jgi:hypothetical protein
LSIIVFDLEKRIFTDLIAEGSLVDFNMKNYDNCGTEIKETWYRCPTCNMIQFSDKKPVIGKSTTPLGKALLCILATVLALELYLWIVIIFD